MCSEVKYCIAATHKCTILFLSSDQFIEHNFNQLMDSFVLHLGLFVIEFWSSAQQRTVHNNEHGQFKI